MRIFAVSFLTAISLAAVVLFPVRQQDDLVALHQCMQLHPERYCRLTHAPSTVAP